MKLNNKGWGFQMMLFLMAILIIFLFVAIYFIYRFYNNFRENINVNGYVISVRSNE